MSSDNRRARVKLAQMIQPRPLRSEEYQVWSRGRGVDVWAMLTAAVAGDLEFIQSLVARERGLLNCEFEYFTPIHFAVRENQQHVVDWLLEQGVDVAYEAGESLVSAARDRGYDELARMLAARLRERYGVMAEGAVVAEAIRERNTDRVRELLDAHPEWIRAADERANQPLHWAVMTRQRVLIDLLLERGADINAARPDGLRPIHLTNGDYHYRGWRDVPDEALQRHEVLIGYLIARGADYDLATAAKLGDLDRVRELVDGDPEALHRVPAYSYYTGLPLRNAAGAGHVEVVRYLLERGADPNQPEPGIAPRGGALHAAIGGEHLEVVRLLLEHGADPNAQVESSGNCLMMAKHVEASVELKTLLIERGAVMGPRLADLETLGAMLSVNTNLDVGERFDTPEMMRLILHYQPELLKQSPDPTPWWSHATPKSQEMARELFDRGLDPNRRNWLGITMLHRCAAQGDVAIGQVLLERGADINAVETEWSSTPLGWAVRHKQREFVRWLVARGADPSLPSDEPWAQPIAWAQRNGDEDLLALFAI